MRFMENGPSIPDELLIARDQSRVVFFCGAGASRAKARLPDFFTLAKTASHALGLLPDSPAQRLLDLAARDQDQSVGNLIATDRIFALLERDFEIADIEQAVANALRPDNEVDLSAHRTLLDLAKTPEGHTHLITTNFDRLFSAADASLGILTPHQLPDPADASLFNGVVHLHGVANSTYERAEPPGFVLSSASFGRAYLSDGWATQFIQKILANYLVVFVGYSADDPPISYLLEAIHDPSLNLDKLFAFQSGGSEESLAKWRHKGVMPIPYFGGESHDALWDTLEAWAERARNPDAWYSAVIDRAGDGPRNLTMHERGQVAHIVSTAYGALKFVDAVNPPPADWLCVFDARQRYGRPMQTGVICEEGEAFDPFLHYGLDSDQPPEPIDPNDHFAQREMPEGVWDAFRINWDDISRATPSNLATLTQGGGSTSLPDRLCRLGWWISKVADQPMALWWAVRQNVLSGAFQELVLDALRRSNKLGTAVGQGWNYLFDAWRHANKANAHDWLALDDEIAQCGWGPQVVRKFREYERPWLACSHSWRRSIVSEDISDVETLDIIRLDVKYPSHSREIDVPPEWHAEVTKATVENLLSGISIEKEIDTYQYAYCSPFRQIPRYAHGGLEGGDNISSFAHVLFLRLKKLSQLDNSSAKEMFSLLPYEDDRIVAQIRIGLGAYDAFVSSTDFASFLASVRDQAFWRSSIRSDLLHTLKDRWPTLRADLRAYVEDRILAGPPQPDREATEEQARHSAWEAASMIGWLVAQGCVLSEGAEHRREALLKDIPEWKPEYALNADEPMIRSGSVAADKKYDELLDLPLGVLIERARTCAGRTDDSFVERNPFLGFLEKRPIRALAALRLASIKELPSLEREWSSFLRGDLRKDDSQRRSSLIARRLLQLPIKQIGQIMRPVASWLESAATALSAFDADAYLRLVEHLILTLKLDGACLPVGSQKQKGEWVTLAINSPAGQIASSLTYHGCAQCVNEMSAGWLNLWDKLLETRGNDRQYVLVIIGHSIHFLFHLYKSWVKANVLPILSGDDSDSIEAFWDGLLWSAHIPGPELYNCLKRNLLCLVDEDSFPRSIHRRNLAGFVLGGWLKKDAETDVRLITDEEMRHALIRSGEEFRLQTLWYMEQWEEKDADLISQHIDFLKRIWPRQKTLRTTIVSGRLCEFLFDQEDNFLQFYECILPLIGPSVMALMSTKLERGGLIDKYPREILCVLAKALPQNPRNWPYETEKILEKIAEADISLSRDDKFLTLRRKWNSR